MGENCSINKTPLKSYKKLYDKEFTILDLSSVFVFVTNNILSTYSKYVV